MTRAARPAAVLSVLLVILGWLAPAAVAAPVQAHFVRIQLSEVTPQLGVSGDTREVKVTGALVNFGDRAVSNLQLRLQRAPAITDSADLRAALVADNASYDTSGRFRQITDVLEPGQRKDFTLTIEVNSSAGGTGPTLGIDAPGVYPLLVNVNGRPDYGGVARLDDARTLLPVLAVPGSREVRDAAPPTDLTLVWPLADNPKLAGGVPGGGDPMIRLVDDSLATSLAPGGRLFGLLAAFDTATSGTSAQAAALRTAGCLAIDPDLLVTVQAMTSPYLVSLQPAEPRGRAVPGSGERAAAAWLTHLRAVASHSCTVALPFGQVDVAALATADDPALRAIAFETPADVVDSILGVTSLRGLAMPTSGQLLDPGADQVRAAQVPATAIAATNVAGPGSSPRGDGLVPLGRDLGAALFDPAVTTALAALGPTDPGSAVTAHTTGTTPTAVRFPLSDEPAVARRGAAVGALMAQALTPEADSAGGASEAGASGFAPDLGRSQLVMPPQIWAATAADASTVLGAVGTLFQRELSTPKPLPEVAAAAAQAAGAPWRLRRPAGTAASVVPAATIARAADQTHELARFQGSLGTDPKSPLTPARYISPLREDVVRALRYSPERIRADGDANTRLDALRRSLTLQLRSVSILSPGGTYTLASDKSPLLLVARNDLPVPIRTRVVWSAPEGVHIDAADVKELPARGTRQLELPTTVSYSKKIQVDLSLQTPTGMALGEPIRISVHSNAYGRTLFLITLGAGVLLVLLAGRRLWRRFRGRPDKADLDRPQSDGIRWRGAERYASPSRAPASEPEPPPTEPPPTEPPPAPRNPDRDPKDP